MLSVYLIQFSIIITLCRGWVTQVDTHVEECFYETVAEGVKLGLTFQVTDGGFLDIDVTIHGPDGREIYVGRRETNGRYAFNAYQEGKYKFCFNNKMSTVTPKSVMFHVLTGTDHEWRTEESEKENSSNRSLALQSAVAQLSQSLWGIDSEQNYIMARTEIHRRISEHTNAVVVRWCVFEVMLIILGTFFEVWYIKRFFEVRRIT